MAVRARIVMWTEIINYMMAPLIASGAGRRPFALRMRDWEFQRRCDHCVVQEPELLKTAHLDASADDF